MDRCGGGGPPTASGRVDRAAGMVRTEATRGAQARSSREDVARDTTARGLSHPPRRAKRSAPPSRSRAKSADGGAESSAAKKDAEEEEEHTAMTMTQRRAGSAVKTSELGDIGYEFGKEFHAGWFFGRVIEIRPYAGE